MKFESPLVPAVLVQRQATSYPTPFWKTARAITGFCPNTGSMRGLTTPGSRIWLIFGTTTAPPANTGICWNWWRPMAHLVGINTGMPNTLAEEAIARRAASGDSAGLIRLVRREQYGRNSRIDFLLSELRMAAVDCYVEVKKRAFHA